VERELAEGARGVLGPLLGQGKPDVIGIQELKLDSTEVPTSLFTERGYFVAMHTQKTWNGVLLAARSEPEDVERGFLGDEGEARLVARPSTASGS
jgi:exodeoxyribonuclease-3